MRAPITLLAITLSLVAGCDGATPRRADRDDPPRPAAAPAAATPKRPAPTPPATTHRTARGGSREPLADFGLPVVIRVPAGAELEWMDASPDVMFDHKTATVRVIHGLDP